MKREEGKATGAPGKAPLLGNTTPVGEGEVVTGRIHHVPEGNSRIPACSADFQTRRVVDPPESAEREAALEVGLEICAARA